MKQTVLKLSPVISFRKWLVLYLKFDYYNNKLFSVSEVVFEAVQDNT